MSTLSTSAESSGTGNSYQNLNISDIESDDSFECEDELIIQDPVEEYDEESIIVAPHQEQTLENVLEMHDQQLAQFIRNYRIQDWRENVFIIFGTWSLFKALALPLDRQLPLRGLEWSFMTLQNNQNSQLNC